MGRDQGDPIMLDALLELPFALNRHRDAPLLEERLAFLKYLQERGTSRAALRNVSGQLLHVIDLLKLEGLRDVSVDEIKQASRRWGERQRTNARARTYVRTESYFEYVAKKWLRFAGRLKSPPVPVTWFTDHLQDFARWMTEEQGLTPLSVRSHCWKASKFLTWFTARHTCLSRVRLQDVDEFLTLKGIDSWNRTSVSVAAQALRAFFRHAERRGWCKAGIAGAIQTPRRYVHEGLPDGPTWEEVQRLLHSIEGSSPSALRARAILLLFAIYGLRSGEVSRLLLSDFDWSAETFLVTHSKRGGRQPYPLQHEVGEAILQYITKVRPRTECRHLFVTLHVPYRSVAATSLWAMTSQRLKAAGISCRRSGPHSLRHACATHLLQEGVSLKEIGDLLGHRSAMSTGVYAKVDISMLRRVADFDLGGLL
jgi:integrase/recombinase XerD